MQLPAIIIKPSGDPEVVRSPAPVLFGKGENAVLHPQDAWLLWSSADWARMCPGWKVLPLIDAPPSASGKRAVQKSVAEWTFGDDAVEVAYALESAEQSNAVPFSVTNFQARAALLKAGLFKQVNDAMLALPVESAARQAWEYANEVTRRGTLVNGVADQLGLTSEQMDDLFRIAATIEA